MNASRCSQCGALSSNPSTAFDISVAAGTRHYTLLHTNEPPEDFETPFIHSVIAKTDARLQCIDDEISKLQEKLDQLEEERTSLSCYRTRNNGILSPLRRFPPEVLGEIFSRTLPSLDDEWDRGRFSTEHSPWLLTHISSHWRTIALSTPSLWSQVLIAYTKARDPLASAYPPSLAEAQIQRAHKLKIHFDGWENGDSRTQIQMFQLLSQHCSRWEELSLMLTSDIAPLLTALRGRLSSLRRLWIQWDPDDHHASNIRTTVESLDCFLTASSLVDAGVNDTCRLASTVFPIQQLTRYELRGPWQQHKSILKLAPSLIEARIQIELDEEDEEEPIDLLHLRRLFISHLRFLNRLRTPVLEGLTSWVTKTQSTEFPQRLYPFLDRSACQLQSLRLHGYPAASATIEVLQKIPSITQFGIDSYTVKEINALMARLAVSELAMGTTVAPQLLSLLFGSEKKGQIDYKVYLEMLKSRWGAEHCALSAATLAVEEGPGPDPATLSDLHALRREGLDLLILVGADTMKEINAWSYSCPWSL